MNCSILHCPNRIQRNERPSSSNFTFHGFPTEIDTFNAWIAATGRKGFIPNLSSKICSEHFAFGAFHRSSGKLRKNAVPTLRLKLESNCNKESAGSELQPLSNDPMSCILGSDAGLNMVEVVREDTDRNVPQTLTQLQECSTPRSLVVSQTTHEIVNIVSSRSLFESCLPDPANTIILNYNQNLMSKVNTGSLMPRQGNALPRLLNVQDMQLLSQSISTSVALTSTEPAKEPLIYSQASTTSESKPCPIKLVDMKKLLEKPPVENEEMASVNQNSIQKDIEENKSTPQTYLRRSNEEDLPKTPSVTVSDVLDCLRVILPRSFVLSRLKPSEKVANLVIRYLKLKNEKSVENIVKVNLKIIIDAAKLQDKEFGDYVTHPYHKIHDIPLAIALARVFPPNLAKSINISDEKLKCLCVVLSQDIFTDGFIILRKKIDKIASKGQKTKNTINQETKKNYSLILENDRHISDNKTPAIPKKRQKLANLLLGEKYDEMGPAVKNMNNTSELKKKDVSTPNKSENNEDYQNTSFNSQNNVQNSKMKSDVKRAKLTSNLKLIITFLELKNCSAKDAMNDTMTMLNLCKYLRIKSRKSNLLKLKKMLSFIIQKNLNKYNTGLIEDTLNRTILDKDNKNVTQQEESVIQQEKSVLQQEEHVTQQEQTATCQEKNITQEQNKLQAMTQTKEVKQASCFGNKNIDVKLKLTPIVVLQNLVDYGREQLLFMREDSQRVKRKPEKYHKLKVPHCFSHNSLQKYSSDHVRKLTCDSYRQFRRILMKRDGEKVVFRLHYNELNPGSSVFVKDFSCPSNGWVKATVTKMNGLRKYIVKLEDGKMWSCVAEQIRPIPQTEHTRSQRNVKPRQLFDL